MKRAIRAVGEDWDDFKVVSQAIKVDHHIAVARDFEVELTREHVLRDWGRGLRYELASYYGHPDPANVSDRDHDRFLKAFNARNAEFPKQLHPDTKPSHDRLVASGLPMFMLTSHLTPNALTEMEMVGIDSADYLFVHGSDITGAIKPSPAAFDKAISILAEIEIDPSEVMYGGDTLGDAISSTEAGMQFMGVTRGRVTPEQFAKEGFQSVPSLRDFTDYVLANSVVAKIL